MILLKIKHIIILLLGVILLSSCGTKKTFNGTTTLPCSDYKNSSKIKKKSKSKWKLVLYKDGEKLVKKSTKGGGGLFKK